MTATLQADAADPAVPSPAVPSAALAATTLPDSDQPGFVLGSQQLPAGQYQAQIERLENGAWVADKQFVLRVEAPH